MSSLSPEVRKSSEGTGSVGPSPPQPIGPRLPAAPGSLGARGQQGAAYLYVQVKDALTMQEVQPLHQLLDVDLDLRQSWCSGELASLQHPSPHLPACSHQQDLHFPPDLSLGFGGAPAGQVPCKAPGSPVAGRFLWAPRWMGLGVWSSLMKAGGGRGSRQGLGSFVSAVRGGEAGSPGHRKALRADRSCSSP